MEKKLKEKKGKREKGKKGPIKTLKVTQGTGSPFGDSAFPT
jgi:hypothetical protein